MKKYLLYLTLAITTNSCSIFCMSENERAQIIMYRVQQERAKIQNMSEKQWQTEETWQRYKNNDYRNPVHSNAWHATHLLSAGTGTFLNLYGLNKISTSNNFFTTHILPRKHFPKKISLLLLSIPLAATGFIIGEILHTITWDAISSTAKSINQR